MTTPLTITDNTLATTQQELVDKLTELRDLARTYLPTVDMTTEQWAQARLVRIARALEHLIEQLEKSTGEQT